MSGDGNHVVCLQPTALAPASCPRRDEYDPALLGPGGCPAILQDSPSSLHGGILPDEEILKLECKLCLRMLPLVDWGSERGSDFPKEEQGDKLSCVP